MMPLFNISVVNQTFETENEHELPTEEAARKQAIRGALEIGIEEVGESEQLFAAEVKVEHEGKKLARYFVSVGVSQLR